MKVDNGMNMDIYPLANVYIRENGDFVGCSYRAVEESIQVFQRRRTFLNLEAVHPAVEKLGVVVSCYKWQVLVFFAFFLILGRCILLKIMVLFTSN